MKSCFGERSTRNAGWVNKKVKSVARWMASCYSRRSQHFALEIRRHLAGLVSFSLLERPNADSLKDNEISPNAFFLKRIVSEKRPAMQRHYMHNGAALTKQRPKPFHLGPWNSPAWCIESLDDNVISWELSLRVLSVWIMRRTRPNVFCISSLNGIRLQSAMNSDWVIWSCGHWTVTMSGLEPQMTLSAELDYAVSSRSMNSVF